MSRYAGAFAREGRPLLVRRLWWAVAWFGVALLIWLSVMHDPPMPPVEGGDKFGHVAAYAMLMLWFAQLLPARWRQLAAAVAFVGLGIGLEFVQGAIGYREFSYADMAANTAGVALGWLLSPPRLPNLLAIATGLAARI